jgi:hypothetical protein
VQDSAGKQNFTFTYLSDSNMILVELLSIMFCCGCFVVAVAIVGHGLCEGSFMTVIVRHV